MFREQRPTKEGIFIPSIEIKEHPQKGYICVAADDFHAGDIIERCPTIIFESEATKKLFEYVGGRTVMHDYMFCMNDKGYRYWAMGYGGLYSHSSNPNARWTITYHSNDRHTIDIIAIKNIKKGEEITHRYVRKVDEWSLWFDPVEE